ncbi:hypothetical protein ACPFTX_003445 [Vibrio cholerae]|uniref:Uncharacterized protein n=1 Tax=Vibrio metoecus TaxID=1481663 RepID=A0ABR4RUS5_VIBMT|nr:hypothetical protein DP83_11840 [Vibrio metoecus]
MSKILEVIRALNAQKIQNEITNSNGFLNPGTIAALPLSLREIAEQLNIEIDELYDSLDELHMDGYIDDLSTTSMSWGRRITADGQVCKTIGHFVKLLV